MIPHNDNTPAFPLIDGPLAPRRRQFCRNIAVGDEDLVRDMAADLLKTDAFRREVDAIPALMWRRSPDGRLKYSSLQVLRHVHDAMQAATQHVVTNEMMDKPA